MSVHMLELHLWLIGLLSRLILMNVYVIDQYIKIFVVCPKRRLAGFARNDRHATVGACHRTSNRQKHKIIGAGPEQDTIFTSHSVQRARQPRS